MDLQAILDEVDSSSDSSVQGLGNSSSLDDLERILREDDDASDGGLRTSTGGSLSSSVETPTDHYNVLSSLKTGLLNPSISYDVDDALESTDAETGGVDFSPEDPVYTSATHNAEDWAVLQQILGEDDKDDEEDFGWMDKHSLSTGPSLQKDGLTITSHNPEVDAILNSSDDDVDLDVPLTSLIPTWSSADTDMNQNHELLPSWSQEDKPRPVSPPLMESQLASKPHLSKSPKSGGVDQSFEHSPELSDSEHLALTDAAMKYAEAYERRLLRSGHRDIVSPLLVKRKMKPRFEVGTRSQRMLSKERLSSVSQQQVLPHFDFSGLMESKNMPKISSYLMHPLPTHGLPTALAVNSKFIAIGFQKGIICVFDLFEVLRQRLGVLIDRPGSSDYALGNVGSVSSIDIASNGETLIAGYTSGAVVLWDIIKGSILRSVTEAHPSPITMVRFLTDRDSKVVSVDAGGLVLKQVFTKNLLWANYSMDYECLLDGAAGQVLAMNILSPFSSIDSSTSTVPKRAQHPFLHKLVLIALSSERSSFVVAVEPDINVLHRWARPPADRIRPKLEGVQSPTITELPCLSWGWALVSGGGNVVSPILARAWGCCIQLLQANFPESTPEVESEEEGHFWPAFGVHDEFDVSSPVVSLEWLGERSLVYLTVTNEFTVVDTVMMTLVERLDFSGLQLVYAEFSLSRSANKEDEGTVSIDFCTTFQNSIRFSDGRILILCQDEIKSVSIIGAKRRISTLEHDGEWLEALALALDHYENTIKSQEDRKRDPDGMPDLSKHPEFSSMIRTEDEEWIAKLLLRYLSLAIENAPEANDSVMNDGVHSPSRRINLAQSHFQMLAGVCIEFCVVTRRLDLLFGPIFRRFFSSGNTSVFLDVLEPYVLNDKLPYIAPEAMVHFIEHCKATNGVATVERCLLHMDVTIMDFDNILNLLRRNDMYSALIHVYTHGLNDFVAPLEILLERVFDAADEGSVSSTRRRDGVPHNAFERFGYKAILYLRRCFEGKTFTKEESLKPDDRLQTLRPQLLRYLLTETYTPSSNVKDRNSHTDLFGHRAYLFPYTHMLLMVDARAFLDMLSIALDAPDAEFVNSKTVFETVGGWEAEVGASIPGSVSEQAEVDEPENSTRCPSIQRIINMLSTVILPDDDTETHSTFGSIGQSKDTINAYLDFLSKYLMKGVAWTSKATTFLIVSRQTDRYVSAKLDSVRERSQDQLIELLTALPRNSYDSDDLLALVDSAGIHRASLLLHQEGVTSWQESNDDRDRRSEHLRRAIDCYLNDDEPDFRKGVFAYVKKECTADTSQLGESNDGDSPTLRGALSEKMTDLVHLDPLLSAQLVAEIFIEELDDIIETLGRDTDSVAQFLFLHAVISGDLSKIDAVAGPVLSANLTMDHHQRYLVLMAKLYPDRMYEYLSTHDNYRPEECLKLCQEHDIADASAYLLERMGNVSSALQLILQTLEARLMGLKRVIRGMNTDSYETSLMKKIHRDWTKDLDPKTKRGKEVKGVKRILVVALDLCERNSGTRSSRSEQSSQLWFNVLDRLINAKGFLRLSKEKPEQAKMMGVILSDLLQMTMQRMVSCVPLPDLVRKVTTEHSGSRLGEFREMLVSMLSTYGFEHDVSLGAVNVMNHDIRRMEREHRRLKMTGSSVQTIMNQPLSGKQMLSLDATLVLRDRGDAVFVDSATSTGKSRSTGGLENARLRLRSRRDGGNKNTDPWSCAKSNLSLMTVSDRQYQDGESDEMASFGERYVGILGSAEHSGRFGYL